MFVLFEESGAFKAGTLLSEQETTLHVELPSGRRLKIKRNAALLTFREPEPQALLDEAQRQAEALDVDFLWEVCGEEEFSYLDFAREYHGAEPSAVEAAALLLRLHASPIHFHRKGKGRFQKAPAEILQAALAGLEKKRKRQEAIERMRDELVAGRLPDEIAAALPQILYRPDRNRPETQALEAASVALRCSTAQLLLSVGAISSTHDYHFGRFLFEVFPEGLEFPAHPEPVVPDDLPIAEVRAFSIDDVSTTEIDDAFSVTPRPGGGWRIGVHIAAPALGLAPGDAIDAIARARMSTVYMPGRKITMLPPDVVECFTLAEGHVPPALSLYLDVDASLAIQGMETRLERVPIAANLRLHALEPFFNEETLQEALPEDLPWRDELKLLWELATVLEAGRGKASVTQNQVDYLFHVDWERVTEDGPGWVSITPRPRGAPIDKLVSEFAILTNQTWGKRLAEHGLPGIYRTQPAGGKVRMALEAESHEGLGVDCYAWSSSPLRRYVDLVNQMQLLATVRGTPAPFPERGQDLLGIVRQFEAAYATYQEFQRHMERYWCLRWLRQHRVERLTATVLRDDLVRCERLPLVAKVPSLPPTDVGQRVEVEVERIDLVEMELRLRFIRLLSKEATADPAADLILES